MKIIFEENSKILSWHVGLWRDAKTVLRLKVPCGPFQESTSVLLIGIRLYFSLRMNILKDRMREGKQEWKKNREGRMKGRRMEEQIDWLMTSSCERWRTGAKRQIKARHLLAALWANPLLLPSSLSTLHMMKTFYILSSLSWLPCGKMPSQAHRCPVLYLNRLGMSTPCSPRKHTADDGKRWQPLGETGSRKGKNVLELELE